MSTTDPNALTRCPGCGVELTPIDGPTHAYVGASPACWERYGELLAREYQDGSYFAVHGWTVDVYSVQHPGVRGRRSAQSVIAHLCALYAALERGADARASIGVRRAAVALEIDADDWLEPPELHGLTTVVDVLRARTAVEHVEAVRRWAADVWDAWAAHHDAVGVWVDRAYAGLD